MLPEHMRKTSRMTIMYADIEKLAGREIARIAEFLAEKVGCLATKTRAERKGAEHDVSGAGNAAMSFCQTAQGYHLLLYILGLKTRA